MKIYHHCSKENPCVRCHVQKEIGKEAMHRLESLGVFFIDQAVYKRQAEQLRLHREYLDLIQLIRDGHASTAKCEQEMLLRHIQSSIPDHKSPSGKAYGRDPRQSDTRARVTPHQA